MRAIPARVIKFSVDRFWLLPSGAFKPPGAPVALVSVGQGSGDLGDGVGGRAVTEFRVLPVPLEVKGRCFRPAAVSAPRPGTLSGSLMDTHAGSKQSYLGARLSSSHE